MALFNLCATCHRSLLASFLCSICVQAAIGRSRPPGSVQSLCKLPMVAAGIIPLLNMCAGCQVALSLLDLLNLCASCHGSLLPSLLCPICVQAAMGRCRPPSSVQSLCNLPKSRCCHHCSAQNVCRLPWVAVGLLALFNLCASCHGSLLPSLLCTICVQAAIGCCRPPGSVQSLCKLPMVAAGTFALLNMCASCHRSL